MTPLRNLIRRWLGVPSNAELMDFVRGEFRREATEKRMARAQIERELRLLDGRLPPTSENTMLTGASYIGALGGQRPDIRRFALNALGGNVPMARAAVAFISEATTSDDEALRIEAVSICRNAESPAEWWSALNFLRGENA